MPLSYFLEWQLLKFPNDLGKKWADTVQEDMDF
jgi:hypothetical protein